MARLATSAAHFCQRLQELYPQKLQRATSKPKSEQSSPFRRWTTGSGAGSSYRHSDQRNIYATQMSDGADPSNNFRDARCQKRVSRWQRGLEYILDEDIGIAAFAHFLVNEFSLENLRFWWYCGHYATLPTEERRTVASQIWRRYLADDATEPINVDAATRRATGLRMQIDPPPVDLFQQARAHVFNLMKFDCYHRFVRSRIYNECVRLELLSVPLPYGTNAPRGPNNMYPPFSMQELAAKEDPVDYFTFEGPGPSRQQARDKSPKLKKSASNASDRRRSGGSSLLPWKLRAPSRERAQQTQPETVTDVVKSSQSSGNQCSLCRVVLPDGATSVVGVDPNLTVGGLVDRLLHRRNLICPTYDVVLKDGGEGDSGIDRSQASTVLGCKEVVVERRAVVKMELGGRCVSVRCGGMRSLKHALKPVLAKYAPQCFSPKVLRADGTAVHPDTMMLELDGARLQVVETVDAGEAAGNVDTGKVAEEDGASIVDLLIPQDDLQDADAQSTTSNTSRGQASAGSSGGRVRAALRQGAPLHHHPPDFLENLRETQRIRLQKNEAGPSPSRNPPPLPPKPSIRPAPTLV